MRIGLVKIGEPLPGEGIRPRRMTRLAQALVGAGHEVVWWTSNWSHQGKVLRPPFLVDSAKKLGFTIRMLPAPPYRRNVSLERIRHHEIFAQNLIAALDKETPPDVLWVCFPAIAHCVALANWASSKGVKLIFDVRDLSPDVFATVAPKPLRPLVRLALSPLAARVGRAFSKADGLVAASDGYLKWGENLARRARRLPPHREVFALGYETPDVSPSRAAEITTTLVSKGFRDNGRLKAVFAGTFGTSYDLLTLIAAARRADELGLDVDFILAGGGDATPMVEAAAREIERLVYVGWLDAETLQVVLARSQFGLMAYADGATQGLPNKLYEYMANGLVVLNSLVGETAAIIAQRQFGITYTAGSADELLAALMRLSTDDDLRLTMSAAATEAFASGFDSDAAAQKMIAFIETIGAERRAAA